MSEAPFSDADAFPDSVPALQQQIATLQQQIATLQNRNRKLQARLKEHEFVKRFVKQSESVDHLADDEGEIDEPQHPEWEGSEPELFIPEPSAPELSESKLSGLSESKLSEPKLSESKLSIPGPSKSKPSGSNKLPEPKLKEILDQVIAAITSLRGSMDQGWEYFYLSAGCERIFGFTSDELKADKFLWQSRIFPEDWNTLFTDQLGESGDTFPCCLEYRFRHKDGSLRWIASTLIARWDVAEKVWFITAVDVDVSHRRQTEGSLRQYERIISFTPDRIAVIDRSYTYRVANEAYMAWHRCSADELIGRHVWELFKPAQFETILKPRIDRCLAGATTRYEEWFEYTNQQGRFVSATYAPYVEPDGSISGAIVNVRDLTELKLVEDALEESDQFLRSIYNNTQVSFFIIDVLDDNFYYLGHNPVHEQLTGLSSTEIQGKTPEQLFTPEVADTVRQHYLDCMAADESITYEEYVPFNGKDYWWITTLTPLRNQQSRIYRLVGSSLNITDRVQAEQAREQQRQKTQLLLEITLKIRQSIHLDGILQNTVDEVQRLLQTDRVMIYQLQADGSGIVTTEAVSSPEMSILEQAFYDPCFGTSEIASYSQGRVSAVSDILRADIHGCYRSFLEKMLVRANLVVPLIHDQTLWGLLIAHQCRGARHWTHDEIEFLQQLAAQVSIAIQQANLFRQVQLELAERQRAETALQQLNRELEERVQERTAQLKLVLSASRTGIWEWDMRTNIEYWSPENYELLGYQTDEQGRVLDADGVELSPYPTHELFAELVPPQEREELRQKKQWSIETRSTYEHENRIIWRDGTVHWYFSRGTHVFDEAGRPIKAIGVGIDITERKRVELALQESEEKFRQLAENIRGVFYVMSADFGQFYYVSPGYEQVWGRSVESLYHTPTDWIASICPEDRAWVTAALQTVEDRENFNGEYRIQRMDGTVRWIQARNFPVQDASGKTYRIVGISEDITDRKRAEEKLLKSEASLAEAQRIAHVGSWSLDVATGMVSWSAEIFRIFRLDIHGPEPTCAEVQQRYIHPDDREQLQHLLNRSIESAESFQLDLRLIRADDSIGHVSMIGQPMLNEQNQVIRVFGTLLDISDRKLTEEALRASEERFAKAFRANPIAIAISSFPDGILLDVNDSYLQLLGYAREEVIGQTTLNSRFWQSAAERNWVIQTLADEQSVRNLEVQFITKSGLPRTGMVSLELIELGDRLCVLKMIYDISDRQQAEARLRTSLQEKEVLLKEIHHRVKNNLQVISSLLNLQARQLPDPRLQEPLMESQRRIKVMAMIHERLYQTGDLARIDFADHIQNLVTNLFRSYLPRNKPIHLHTAIDNVAMSVNTAIPCGLIINELVSNAIKYAFPAEHSGEIAVIFTSNNFNQYTLTIRDNGIGFPEHIDFRNTDSLGLRVVCALVKQLDGTIALNHTNGTAFSISFSP